MSNTGVLGLPQSVEIGGRKALLHPLGIYELGLCESSYGAYLTRQALEATVGLDSHVAQDVKTKAAEQISNLEIDINPVLDWIVGTYEGIIRGLCHCLEFEDGRNASPRLVGQWYQEMRNENTDVYDRWMIDSKLRSDPTAGESVETAETSKADDEVADKEL